MADNMIKENCLSIIERLQSYTEVTNLPGATSELDRFRSRLLDEEFRIAVVGEYSSGKSTFINAILGKDILTHATTETTATITKIVNVSSDDHRCYTGDVLLKNGSHIQLENFNDLREYTTKGSHGYDVVNDVVEVELYVPIFPSSKRIVIIDTPGLNGIAEGHREKTIELVQQAHSCIYLLQLRGLSESDVSFVRFLSRYQKNFIFVQNFIDEFRRAEGDALPQKLDEQRKILSEQVFDQCTSVNYTVCGVSALMALTAVDADIPSLYEGGALLTPETRNALYGPSNFAEFRSILTETFKPENLDRIQYADTAYALKSWLLQTIDQISQRERLTRDAYSCSQDHKARERLHLLRQKVLNGKGRQVEYLHNYISSSCVEIQKEEVVRLAADLDSVSADISNIISQHTSIESLDHWILNIAQELHARIDPPIQNHLERYSIELHSLYQRILHRIEEYTGIQNENLAFDELSLKPLERPTYSFEREDTIAELQQKVKNAQKDAEKHLRNQAAMQTQCKETEHDIQQLRSQQMSIDSHKQLSITNLGARPQIVKRTEYYTAHEYRGGLGILDKLFGPKEVTRSRIITDDSAAKAWDAKKAQILNAHAKKTEELTRQLHAANRALDRRKREAGEASQGYSETVKRIAELEKQIKDEEKLLRVQKEKAAFEFLEKYKRDLKKQVTVYLLGEEDSVFAQAEERLRQQIAKAEEDFICWSLELFEKAINQKLMLLDKALEKECPDLLIKADNLAHTNDLLVSMCQSLEVS